MENNGAMEDPQETFEQISTPKGASSEFLSRDVEKRSVTIKCCSEAITYNSLCPLNRINCICVVRKNTTSSYLPATISKVGRKPYSYFDLKSQ